jgi:hypothetical protein
VLVFPQLLTGASVLYPATKRTVLRTVVNVLGDGRTDVFEDPRAAYSSWELRAAGLTLVEWTAIETLYKQTSGKWGTFTFLDPTGNLLAQSENFGNSIWTNGPLIQLTPGVADPLGTTRAMGAINTGQADAAIAQTLNVPGNFQYCLSVWARSAAGSRVTLQVANITKSFTLTGQWQRIFVAGNPGQTGVTTITFGAHLDAGGSVALFGMQAEAQLGPSDYKQTGTSGGVYPQARFDTDQLTATAQGTDVYDTLIQIVNTAGL